MNHQPTRMSPNGKQTRFNNSVKVPAQPYPPSLQVSTKKLTSPDHLCNTATTSKIGEGFSSPIQHYYSTKGLAASVAIQNMHPLQKQTVRPVSTKRLRAAKGKLEGPTTAAPQSQFNSHKHLSSATNLAGQHRQSAIHHTRSQRRLETHRSEAKETVAEVQRLQCQVQQLKTQRNGLIQMCNRFRQQREVDRERIRDYENQMTLQVVNFRKRIRNLQYELRESRSVEKRIYHLSCYEPSDYDQFAPVLNVNRIEETTEKEEQSQVKSSASRQDHLPSEFYEPRPSVIAEELSTTEKKDESTISDLSLESLKVR